VTDEPTRARSPRGAQLLALLLVVAALAGVARKTASGWIGVTLAEDRAAGAAAVRIETVLPESPAFAAGLASGDVVRAVGARTIHAARELSAAVRRTTPDAALTLHVEHGGNARDVPIRVGARPPDLYRLVEADRGTWQDPARVLALLDAAPAQTIADIGAGGGYFTARLAAAVGSQGRVIAVDIDAEALTQLLARFAHATNVDVRRGLADDPRLAPDTLDGVLLVDTFHELTDPAATLIAVRRALRRGGRLVIVDRAAPEYVAGAHAIPEARVLGEAEAAGFRLRERADLPRQFALVLE
jgi:SAM-dependent methyltransferase